GCARLCPPETQPGSATAPTARPARQAKAENLMTPIAFPIRVTCGALLQRCMRKRPLTIHQKGDARESLSVPQPTGSISRARETPGFGRARGRSTRALNVLVPEAVAVNVLDERPRARPRPRPRASSGVLQPPAAARKAGDSRRIRSVQSPIARVE